MFEDSYLDSFMEDHINGGAGAYYDECYYEDQDRDIPEYDEDEDEDSYYDEDDGLYEDLNTPDHVDF